MDWDKLRVFHAVAEAGSFTHAGESLNISQSAVSRQISELEESLSVPLFHRHARGLILTEQGELLFRTAREVFAKLSMAEGFLQILPTCRVEPRPGLVSALVSKGRELLLTAARLYDDVLPFLEKLRSRGIAIAIVSNCDENMREVLSELGVSAFADALALSCEVGAAKPEARIYRHALEALGVTAEAALFVDDNAAFCAAGAAMGLSAVQIVRGQAEAKAVPGITVVRSLSEVEAMF